MGCGLKFRNLWQSEKQRWLFLVVMVTITHFLFQSFLLPYGNALRSLLQNGEVVIHDLDRFPEVHIDAKSVIVRNPLTVNATGVGEVKVSPDFDGEGETEDDIEEERIANKVVEFEEKKANNTIQNVVDNNVGDGSNSDKAFFVESIDKEDDDRILDDANDTKENFLLEQLVDTKVGTSSGKAPPAQGTSLRSRNSNDIQKASKNFPITSPAVASSADTTNPKRLVTKANSSLSAQEIDLFAEINDIIAMSKRRGQRIMRCEMPPKSVTPIHEMKRILKRGRLARRPRWTSARDRDILNAKLRIESAPQLTNEEELYAPLFRNVSRFKRSYELMERTLKIYVYKDGEKPIFHQPILKGLYASEGWFMKLTERNKNYVVKDPRRAHLFYMPFSSRMLEYTLYVRNSHNRTNLRQYLKDYTEKIAARYPFFNRTDGADHFLVACHDWAPYETRHHMEYCIKAMCNADVTTGFKIGRDISLPETYVRSQRNPLRDLGGKPPSRRHILAFYAGSMHGYLRTILLKYWKDKDPDMKIFGPMPKGVASKMNYIEHMKSSKYCICPKGYEVNSPRVVESIFYECVPVIISDNFVPPFFDVLDWDAFSVIIAEKDIPKMKDILLSIPNEKYLRMQLAVRKLQRHFLWHAKPLKYDLYNMVLHSIWYSRLSQINLR